MPSFLLSECLEVQLLGHVGTPRLTFWEPSIQTVSKVAALAHTPQGHMSSFLWFVHLSEPLCRGLCIPLQHTLVSCWVFNLLTEFLISIVILFLELLFSHFLQIWCFLASLSYFECPLSSLEVFEEDFTLTIGECHGGSFPAPREVYGFVPGDSEGWLWSALSPELLLLCQALETPPPTGPTLFF